MKAALAARLRRLETHHRAIEDSSLKVTFAKLTILPPTLGSHSIEGPGPGRSS